MEKDRSFLCQKILAVINLARQIFFLADGHFVYQKPRKIICLANNFMKSVKDKIKKTSLQCGLCRAQFEVSLNNSRLSDERKEKIGQHFLKYCPVCERVDEKN